MKLLINLVLEGNRIPDITYGGNALRLDGMKYYWRIKLWDDDDNEGQWTNGQDYFVMQGKRIQDLSYTYDDVGNIMRIDDQSETNTRKTAEYEYDDLYRLTSATITDSATQQDYTQTYTYDSLGNFTNRSDAGDYTYSGNTGTSYANPHAVTDVGGLTINYDYNGNLTDAYIGNWHILQPTWDYNNRMAGSTGIFQTSAAYSYDQNGERIIKDVGSGSAITIYPNKYYEKKVEGENETVTENAYANGQLVLTATNDGSSFKIFYVHNDHLTSSSVMTKDDGTTEQVLDYYPYGNIRFNEQNSPYDQARKFTGHEYDGDTTLQYFGARYYQGDVGRFWSEDPMFLAAKFDLSNPQTLNAYSYVKNNPLRYFDPLGLFEVETGKIERGDTLSSIAPQINKQYGTNLSVKQIAQANNIKDPNKIKTGDYLALPNKTNLELRFDNKNLQAYDAKYNIPYSELKWPGVSGNANNPPIPEGNWSTDPSKVQYFEDLSIPNRIGSWASPLVQFLSGKKVGSFPGGTAAWGGTRLELDNVDTGQQNTGYYIHGGWFAGSAGCIDLTFGNPSFQNWFKSDWGKQIDVIVNY